MDLETATARAERRLRELESDLPLRLVGGNGIVELDEVWAFAFDSVKHLDEDDVLSAVPSGPIVVPKDGSSAWVAPSAYPIEKTIELLGPHGDRRPHAQ